MKVFYRPLPERTSKSTAVRRVSLLASTLLLNGVVATGGGALAITAEGFGPELSYNDIAAYSTPYTVIENRETGSRVTAYVPSVAGPLTEAPPVRISYHC